MKIGVSNLILEVTRRCNLKCAHCLRGAAQRIDMSNEIIDTVLKQVSYISSITFTGGDPSLNIPAIDHFTDVIRDRKIPVSNFYVVTNGKKNAKSLALSLIELYDACNDMDEMSTLAMSRDAFHEEIPIPSIFGALKFFRDDAHVKRDHTYYNLINEGRAKSNQMGTRNVEVEPFECTNGYADDDLSIEQLYIAANGNVITGCDFSFKRVDAESFGNVLHTPLDKIIQALTKKGCVQ